MNTTANGVPSPLHSRSRSLLARACALLLATLTMLYMLPMPPTAHAVEDSAGQTAQAGDPMTTSPDTSDAQSPQVRIDDIEYATLDDAFAHVSAGQTITLLRDLDLSNKGALNIPGLVIDLNGHTIFNNNMGVVFEGSGGVLRNGNFVGTDNASYGLFVGDSLETDGFTLENLDIRGGVNVFNASNVVLRNVNANAAANSSPYYAVWCDVNANVIIESGDYTSDGAAVLGLTDQKDGQPASTMRIEGGNFYTKSSTLVLGGDTRYKPTITGGTFFNQDAMDFLGQGYCLVAQSDGRFAVREEAGDVQPAKDSTLPSGLELVEVKVTPQETQQIDMALQIPAIKDAMDASADAGALWTTNVILRDKATLEPRHDTRVSCVLAYPDGFDASHYADYDFTVLHLQVTTSDGSTAIEPVLLPADDVKAQADGLHVTSTLSPFAIGYTLTKQPTTPDNPKTPDTPSTPTAPDTPQTPGANATDTPPSESTTTQADSQAHASDKNAPAASDAHVKADDTVGASGNATTSSPAIDTNAKDELSDSRAPRTADAIGMPFVIYDGARSHTGTGTVVIATMPLVVLASTMAVLALGIAGALLYPRLRHRPQHSMHRKH